MAVSFPIRSLRNEFLLLEKVSPISVIGLKEKFDHLAILIKDNYSFRTTSIVSKLIDATSILCKLNEQELKSSSEKFDKTEFIKACEEVNRLFYMVNKCIDEEEDAVADSLVKILEQINLSKKSFINEELAKILSCLPLLTKENNRMKLARTFISGGSHFLKYLSSFKLSEENIFEIAKMLIKIPDFETALENYIKNIELLKSLGIKQHFQIFELIKILIANPKTKSKGEEDLLWIIARTEFGKNPLEIFELAKIFLLNNSWQESWCLELKSDKHKPRTYQKGNEYYWPFDHYFELCTIAIELNSKTITNSSSYSNLLRIRGEIQENKDKIPYELMKRIAVNDMRSNLFVGDDLHTIFDDEELPKIVLDIFQSGEKPRGLSHILNTIAQNKENYPKLLEIAEIIFDRFSQDIDDRHQIELCEWLKPSDLFLLAQNTLEKKSNAAFAILRLVLKKEFFLDKPEFIFNLAEKAILSGTDFVVESVSDKLAPDQILKLVKIEVSLRPVNIIFITRWIKNRESLKKEFYLELLDIATIAVSKNPKCIGQFAWLESKDFLKLAKIAITSDVSTILECLIPGMSQEDLKEIFEVFFNPEIYRRQYFKKNSWSSEEIKSFKFVSEKLSELVEQGYFDDNIMNNFFRMVYEFAQKCILSTGWVESGLTQLLPKKMVFDFFLFYVKKGISLTQDDSFNSFTTKQMMQLLLIQFENVAAQWNHHNIRFDVRTVVGLLQKEYSVDDQLPECMNHDLQLIENPCRTFRYLQAVGFSKDNFLFHLISPLFKEIKELPEMEQAQRIESYEPMLRWLGYVDLKQQIMKISKEKMLNNLPLIEQIMEIQNPQLRYDLSGMFFDQHPFFDAEVLSEGERKESLEEDSYKIFGEGNELFHMLLMTFLPLFEGDWGAALRVLRHPKFQTGTARITLITFFTTVYRNDVMSMSKKAEFVRAFFAKIESKRTEEIILVLREVQALFFINDEEYLSELLKIFSKTTDYKKSVEMLLMKLFRKKLEIFQIEKFDKLIEMLITDTRQPMALFVYFSRLQKLSESERKNSTIPFKAFVESVIDGSFPQIRYHDSENPHLEFLINKLGVHYQEWQKGERASIEDLMKEVDESSSPIKVRDFRKDFFTNVCSDLHFNFLDESSTKPSFLFRFLSNPLDYEMLKVELTNALAVVNEKVKKNKEECLGKSKSNEDKALNILLVKLRIQRQLIECLHKDCKDPISKLNAAYKLIKEHFPEITQAIADIDLYQAIIQESGKIRKYDLSKYTIVDTDYWEDLFLCGTEVAGSCQHIDRDASLNKCLPGYLMDGKIRMAAVKDENGKVIARRILRLLIDKKNDIPVLYQERLYANLGVPVEALKALDTMILRRAKKLGLHLISTNEDWKKESDKMSTFPPYLNDLESFKSPARYEYVDAGALAITDGEYTIPAKVSEVRWSPKQKSFLSEIDKLRKRLQFQ